MPEQEYLYKTYMGKSLFDRDVFIIGPRGVIKRLEELEDTVVSYLLVDSMENTIGNLTKRFIPLPIPIIILNDPEYFEINTNSSSMNIYNMCHGVNTSQDIKYLEELTKALYSEDVLISKRLVLRGIEE